MRSRPLDIPDALRERYPEISSSLWDNLLLTGDSQDALLVADRRNGQVYTRLTQEMFEDTERDLMISEVIPALRKAAPIHRRMYPKVQA